MKMLKIHMEIVSTIAESLISSLFSVNIVLVSVVQVKCTHYMFPRYYPKFF